MPRPREFADKDARRRARELLNELYPEYQPSTEAAPVYDCEATKEDKRRAEKARADFRKRVERESAILSASAAELVLMLGLSDSRQKELIAELSALLANVRWDWRSGRKVAVDPLLPVLGGVQPTHGEMRATVNKGLRHAVVLRDALSRDAMAEQLPGEKSLSLGVNIERLAEALAKTTRSASRHAAALRSWYRYLPPGLLLRHAVMTAEQLHSDEPFTLGGVTERAIETLAILADQFRPKPGRQPGERLAAQGAARWLIWFINKHVPDASIKTRRSFVFACMCNLGIPCPNLSSDPGDFNVWFDDAETLARPAIKADPAPSQDDDPNYDAVLHRLNGAPI